MFKNFLTYLKDEVVFETALISLLILTLLVAIEIFTGWSNREPTEISMENIVYHNLVQEDKNNKIKIKNFGAITDDEYNEIKRRMSDKAYKDLSLEERIIQNYILSYNGKNTVESKENLEKELNNKYSDFKKETTDQIEKINSCLPEILLLSYFAIVLYVFITAASEDNIFLALIGVLSLATVLNFVKEFFPGSTKMLLILYIVLDILLIVSKFLYSKNFFRKYEIARKFEEVL